MRRLRAIRRAEGMKVDAANYQWGTGEVTIGEWTGSVVWGTDENGWEHVSVAPYDRKITPSWDDMCRLKDIFFEEDELALQFHPPKDEYVNMVENCLHLWRPKDEQLLERLRDKD